MQRAKSNDYENHRAGGGGFKPNFALRMAGKVKKAQR